MPRPSGDIHWATNATYNAPGKTWDGDPTKVEPPSGLKDQGHEPTGIFAIEFHNWWRNRVAELIDYTADIQAWTWIPFETLPWTAYGLFITPQPVAGLLGAADQPARWFLGTIGPTNPRISYNDRWGDATQWNAAAGIPIGAQVDIFRVNMATGHFKALGVAAANDGWYSVDYGANWTAQAGVGWAPGPATGVSDLLWFKNLIWVVAFAAQGNVLVTTDEGATWATIGPPGISVTATPKLAASNSTAVMIYQLPGAGSRLSYSTDGLVWTAAITLATGIFDSVVFARGPDVFVATGTDDTGNNAVWTSTDGVAWTQQTDPQIALFPGPITFANGSAWNAASDVYTGPFIIGVVKDVTVASPDRIAYSTDLGVSWTEGPVIAKGQSGFGIFGFAENRFWLHGQDESIYQSLTMK